MKEKPPAKRPLIACLKCGGTGQIQLHDSLWEVFQIVHQRPGISAPSIFELVAGHQHIGVTAINRRLDDLMAMGFVRRERKGTHFAYYIVARRKVK